MEVSEILGKVDILEYISQYCDFEERNGEYWALSPFTDEKTPSFSVSVDKQNFYDFSSGKGGNLLSFIQLYNSCDFLTALDILKKYAGVTDDTDSPHIRLSCTKVAKKFRQKPSALKAQSAGTLPNNYMDRYTFDKSKLKIWMDEGISEESLRKFHVRYDRLSNRIVFPVRDYSGNIINICGRTLDPEFKEKKIPKYIYFKSLGTLNTIYGFSENEKSIAESNSIILFEGAKSVMLASEFGVHNTGAILTSHLSEHQFVFLAKLGVRVIFALDKGINILKDKNVKRLKHYVPIEYITDTDNLLEDKMSPVDAGEHIFMELFNSKIPLR